MKILARRGKDKVLMSEDGITGHIYDEKTDTHYPDDKVKSILARGYWEPVEG